MKRALIVAATGGFLNGFLIPDMKLLQEMGYEVHCAANGNSVSTFVPEERFASIGVTFHQIDFSSTSPVSKESLTAYEPYIFAYFLGANPEYRKQVRKLAESTGLKIVALRHMDQYVEDDESFGDYAPYDVAPDRFLNLLRGAEYVCTDSFHGTCFSIINEKRFMIFNRYANTSATSKNSRIDSLCQNLGVSDRRFSGDISTIQKIIDYEKVYCKLAKLKQKTDQYINAAFMG